MELELKLKTYFPNLTKIQIKKLCLYHQELLRFKNLFLSKKDPKKELARLMMDGVTSSLLLLKHLSPQSMMDVGSGAGFPGILLAILSSKNFHLILVEPSLKKVEFLKHTRKVLNLQRKITIQPTVFQATDIKITTFKAFAPLKKTLLLIQNNLSRDATSYHFKSMSYQKEWEKISTKEQKNWNIKILESYTFENKKRVILEIKQNVPRGT